MTKERKFSIWWGPPRKYAQAIEERKISWLELFYDLVYVIAISRATHHLAAHPDATGMADYAYLFIIIYWGWVNGSVYYDLHGSPGIRTRLMTLWQMMAVAALIVCLDGHNAQNRTAALMVLQAYITYLWWSVGLYDKAHRRLNRPYLVCYLISLALLFATFYIDEQQARPLSWLVLLFNFLPPFLTLAMPRKEEFVLSSSMVERLGLFTIILFGEAVLGVVTGADAIPESEQPTGVWFCFGMSIAIVFALWWVFFALIADQKSKRGLLYASLIEIGYIPTLAALGILATSFQLLYHGIDDPWGADSIRGRITFGLSIALFLGGILLISFFLDYAEALQKSKNIIRWVVGIAAFLIAAMSIVLAEINLPVFLVMVFVILVTVIALLTAIWFKIQLKAAMEETSRE